MYTKGLESRVVDISTAIKGVSLHLNLIFILSFQIQLCWSCHDPCLLSAFVVLFLVLFIIVSVYIRVHIIVLSL